MKKLELYNFCFREHSEKFLSGEARKKILKIS